MATSTSTIKMTIECVKVEGEVAIHSAYDFSITITKPFTGRTGGSHIPCFARAYEFNGEYGDLRMIEVLRELYDEGPPKTPAHLAG